MRCLSEPAPWAQPRPSTCHLKKVATRPVRSIWSLSPNQAMQRRFSTWAATIRPSRSTPMTVSTSSLTASMTCRMMPRTSTLRGKCPRPIRRQKCQRLIRPSKHQPSNSNSMSWVAQPSCLRSKRRSEKRSKAVATLAMRLPRSISMTWGSMSIAWPKPSWRRWTISTQPAKTRHCRKPASMRRLKSWIWPKLLERTLRSTRMRPVCRPHST